MSDTLLPPGAGPRVVVSSLSGGGDGDAALRRSEARYRALAEASTRMVWTTDRHGMVEDMPGWRAITGQTADQVRGVGWLEAIHAADRERVSRTWWDAYDSRGVYVCEYRIRLASGGYRWYRARAVPVLEPGGEVVEWVGVLDDVDERRHAEARKAMLEEAGRVLGTSLDPGETLESVARLAVPHLADGCAVDLADERGALRRVTVLTRDPAKAELVRELERRFPTPIDSPAGHTTAFRTGRPQLVERFTDDLLRAASSCDEHFRLWKALDMHSALCVPMSTRGRTIGVLTFVSTSPDRHFGAADLDAASALGERAASAVDNARLYAQAQAASRAKSDFLATMSHELRTPIHASIGYVELLEMGLRGEVSNAQRHDLHRIRANQQHLLAIINDILGYARIEAGQVHYDPRELDAGEILQEAGAMVEPQARAKGITLSMADSAGVRAVADGDKLRQVLLNLLSNAVKFTPPGGSVHAAAAADEDAVRLSVRDTGIGIPAEKQAAIFEPFVQLDQELTRVAEGTGLGLAISRDLARGMGGELHVQSAPGAGSTFTLVLPLPPT